MSETESDGLDNLLNEIGMGRWQILGLLANFLIWSVLSPHTIGTTLFNAPVPFKCLSATDSFVSHDKNLTTIYLEDQPNNQTYFDEKCLKVSSEPENKNFTFLLEEDVLFQDDPLSHSLIPSCPRIHYDRSIFQSTISTEWNLICEHEIKRPLFQNTYTIGLIVGCVFGGSVGDRLGRARAVFLGSIAHAFATVTVAFTTNFIVLLIGRFIVGLTNLMILVTVVTLSLETCPEKFRGPIGMGVGFPYSLGIVFFAGLGVFLRDWRHLYIATSFPALLLIPVAWLLDESPRWLLQVGRLEEATMIMEKAAAINKLSAETKEKIPFILKEVMQKETKNHEIELEKSVSLADKLKRILSAAFSSLRTPEMRKINIICPTVWFLNEVVYYGTIFNANRFSGLGISNLSKIFKTFDKGVWMDIETSNPFLYVALTGVADGVAILFGVIGCTYGRRITVAGSQFISGMLILLVLAVPDELKWLQWLFVMTGFLMCACASQALFVYTPELYPTVIRARGFAFSNFAGYSGTFVAPFIPDVLAPLGWWITNTILGTIGFITCAMVMTTLPETNHLPMCETIQDVEARGNKIKRIKQELETQKNECEAQNKANKRILAIKQGIDNPALEKDV